MSGPGNVDGYSCRRHGCTIAGLGHSIALRVMVFASPSSKRSIASVVLFRAPWGLGCRSSPA